MKRLSLTVLFFLATASLGQAQLLNKGVKPVPGVSITHVDAASALAPGRIDVLGTQLGLITEVRVAGVPVPVLHNDGSRIVIQPGDQVPGFGVLELFQPGRVHTAPIEFLPSLGAHWRNGRVSLRLHPGESGWYLVLYSFRMLETPNTYTGIYYSDWLDLNGPHSGALFTGAVAGDETLVFPPMRVPTVSLIGPYRSMHVQALCMGQENVCYSNVVTLRPTL